MSEYRGVNGFNVDFEDSKQLAFGGIGVAYAEIGTLDYPSRQYIVSNFTNVSLWISLDGVTDSFPIATGSVYVSDVLANNSGIPAGKTFFAKQFDGAAGAGSVVVSSMYKVKA